MITEALLILPLYLLLLFIWLRFQHIIKAIEKVGSMLNDDDFFGDIVDTPKEGIEQHRKREWLKSVIDRGKTYLLGIKWTHERVDKASDEFINKAHVLYKQHKLNEKCEKLEKP